MLRLDSRASECYHVFAPILQRTIRIFLSVSDITYVTALALLSLDNIQIFVGIRNPFRGSSAAEVQPLTSKNTSAFSAAHNGIHSAWVKMIPNVFSLWVPPYSLLWKVSARSTVWEQQFEECEYWTVHLWCYSPRVLTRNLLSEVALTCNWTQLLLQGKSKVMERWGGEGVHVANSMLWQAKHESNWKQTVIITSRWLRGEHSDIHCYVPCQGVRWSGVAKGWLDSYCDLLRKVNLSFFVTQMGLNDCKGCQEVELPARIITKMCHSISLTNW